ncbi:MAG: glycosyltransferase family 4 protein [Planctomycetes bacterium]|nr:glycosyltransferase family 4 protein [Planctomycetota bacterium]
MKLAVDARTIFRAERRGTGKNLIDLVRHVAALRPGWEIVLFHRRDGVENPLADLPNVRACPIEMPGDRWDLWQQVRLPWAAWRAGADVLHCPANTAPRRCPVRRVLTIHDLIPMDRRFNPDGAEAWAAEVTRAARGAAAILTPSAFTAELVQRVLGVPADKITVNWWAPDAACRRITDDGALTAVRAKYGLDAEGRWVLAFGGADPRKNTSGLLDAWAAIDRPVRAGWSLLVVGLGPEDRQRFERRTVALDIAGRCRLEGFADEADLPALISAADVMAYPSLSEGFGLPIVDAFVCGTAVLTSRTTSMPEIAGEAAELVDPDDTGDIARGLAALMAEPERRARCAASGLERAKLFSWDATARRAIEVFQRVAGEDGAGGDQKDIT